MTMMNEVSGAWVTAARKPAMPNAIKVVDEMPRVYWAMSLPIPPPIASDGAKMPAGTPAHVVIQVATNLSRKNRPEDSSTPSSRSRVCR